MWVKRPTAIEIVGSFQEIWGQLAPQCSLGNTGIELHPFNNFWGKIFINIFW